MKKALTTPSSRAQLDKIFVLGSLFGASTWFCCLFLTAFVFWLIVFVKKKRIHYVEIHEKDWCPEFIRMCTQMALHSGWITFGLDWIVGSAARTVSEVIIREIVSKVRSDKGSIENVDKNVNAQKVVFIDLCSGGGGPTPFIHHLLRTEHLVEVETYLSDLHPQVKQWKYLCVHNDHLKYVEKSMNALSIDMASVLDSKDSVVVRSMYASFHHFLPLQVIHLLSDCIVNGHALIVVEPLIKRDHVLDFLQFPFMMILQSPLYLFWIIRHYLFAPDYSIFEKFTKIFLSIVGLPLWLATLIHDGVVSCARTYTHAEMLELTKLAEVDASKKQKLPYSYQWKAWTENAHLPFLAKALFPMTFLVGMPVPLKN
ncbi:hypothetical protein RFI_08954 [Reticulomyxa filosa]|uniref:Uncharacterized protein n=1 Tax=Reticulomyxa filosa TaxID=46433 RepID=X6NQ78_RETFI|nr:hypothetical protein RFI_08954 [Reticulomyxa filosa]|eukprot:ETO28176.1 hypothetical protein RFI_08954 [Reticulomyxa filosa]